MTNTRDQWSTAENVRIQQVEEAEIEVLRKLRRAKGARRERLLLQLGRVRRRYDRPPTRKVFA